MNKVLLGLSGGVDSAVAAAKLKEQGFEVTGCFLILTDEGEKEKEGAEIIAEHLGIPLVTADFRKRFKENVSDYFINEYLEGRTPNPCVRCNPTTKIQSLLDTADTLGIEKIATGHYALTEFSKKYGGTVLKAVPTKKDQSYFLSRLSPRQIERVLFPLGCFNSKDEVRDFAEALNLPNAKRGDSQEICFIPDNDYQKYICTNSLYKPQAGKFLDNDGNIIGQHSGIINYTVGQRKGLGAFGEPRYVKEINAKDNTVTLCKKDERFENTVTAGDISLAVNYLSEGRISAFVKIRSTAAAVPAEVTFTGGKMNISFNEKVMAPTPGQTAAVYDGDTVIASGIIEGKTFL